MATADKVREVCKHKSASEHKKKKSKLISEKVGHIDDDNDDDLSVRVTFEWLKPESVLFICN